MEFTAIHFQIVLIISFSLVLIIKVSAQALT